MFAEWTRLIIEDDLFEGEEDEDQWIIDETNALELIEALNYHQNDMLLEDEVLDLLKDGVSQSTNDDKIVEPSSKPWSKLKYQIYNLLVQEK